MTIAAGGVTANDLTFNTTGYTISGGTLTLNGTTPTLTAGTGIAATISSVIGGSSGLTKAGAGTLTLNGSAANSVTGGIIVSSGTLSLNFSNFNSNQLIASTNSLTLSGGTLNIQGNNTASAANIQTFTGTTLNARSSTVQLAKGTTGTSVTLNLGALTRAAGGVVFFQNTTSWTTTASTTEIVRVSGVTNVNGAVTIPTTGPVYVGAGFFNNTGTSTRYVQALGAASGPYQLVNMPSSTGWMTSGSSATVVYNAGTTAQTLLASQSMYAIVANGASTHTLGSATTPYVLTTNGILNINTSLLTLKQGTGGGSLQVGPEADLVINNASSGGVAISAPIINQNNGADVASAVTINSTGSGVVTLSGANTFSGGVYLNLGALSINSATALGAGSGTFVINGGTIDNSTAAAITISNNNPLTLNGDFTFTGTQNLNLGSGATSLGTAAGTARTVTTTANTLTIGGVISNGTTATGIIKAGAGLLTLSGANTFSGGVTLNAGTLNINHANALGASSGTFVIGGGTINNSTAAAITLSNYPLTLNGDFTFTGTQNLNLGSGATSLGTAAGTTRTVTTTANTLTIGGVISDGTTATGIIKAGAGLLTLSGANTFSGGVTLNAGTLNINHANALGASSGTFVIGGGTIDNSTAAAITLSNYPLTLNANFTFTGTQNLNLGSGATSLGTAAGTARTITTTANTLTIGGVISDGTTATGIIKAGAGLLTLSGANTFSGGVTLNAGTLNINHANALGASSGTFVIGGGTINNSTAATITLSNYPLTLNGDFTFTGTQNLNLGSGATSLGTAAGTARTITTTANTLTIGGTISDGTTATGITKAGAGTLTLSGSNAYSGLTTISAGTLRVGSTNALGSAGVSLATSTKFATGTTLELATDSSIAAEWLDAPSNVNATVILNRATAGAGFTQSLGTQYIGATSTLNVTAGSNITSGVATLSLDSVILSGGSAGTSTFNPTTAALLIGSVSSLTDFAKTMALGGTNTANVISGIITNGTNVVSVTKSNTGAWQLSGANTYTGVTTVTGGTLRIGVDTVGTVGAITSGPFGTGTLTFNGGTVSSNGTTARTILNALNFTGNAGLGDSVNNGPLTFSATGTLGAAVRTLTVNSDAQFDGVLSGAGGGITKAGAGTLTLTAANTFTGVTTVTGGTLRIGVDTVGTVGAITSGPFGTGTLTFNGGTVSSNGTTARTILNALNFTGNAGLGDSVNNGALTFSATGTLGAAVRTLTVNSETQFDGVLSGAGGITKAGSGTLTLTAANTYTGVTTVTAGTLKLTNALALQSSAFDASGAGTLDLSTLVTPTFGGFSGASNYALPSAITSLTLNPADTITFTYTGAFSGGASGLTLVKSGAGTQVLGAANTYSGDTTISAGSLQISNSGALGTSANILVSSGASGALVLSEPSAGAGLVAGLGKALTINGNGVGTYYGALTNATGTTGVTEWQGTVSIGENATRIGAQGGTLRISGNISATVDTHQLVVRNNGGITVLTGNNTNAGGVNILVGELHVSGGSALHDAGLITLANAASVVFRVIGSETIGALTGAGTTGGRVTVDSGQNLKLASSATPQTFAGVIEGAGSFEVAGAQQTLSNQNTLTGGITVSSGTLTLGHATNTLPNAGAVTVSGGFLVLGTNTDTVGVVTLSGGSITGTGTGALTGSAYAVQSGSVSAILAGTAVALTKTTSGTVTLTGANTYGGMTTVSNGTLALGAGGSINSSGGVIIDGSAAKLVQGNTTTALIKTVTLTQGTLTGSGSVSTVNVGAGTGGIISNNDGAGGASLTIGALNLAGGAAIRLYADGTNVPLRVTTLTNDSAAGTVIITANSPTGWTNGTTYDLISYTTLAGTGLNNFGRAVNNLSARQSALWADSGSAIRITISGTNPYWVGGTDNKWNLAETFNWNLASNDSPTNFQVTDDVVFNDSAAGSGTLTVDIDQAHVSPNTTTFNNSTRNYVLTGAYGIASGNLTKTGNGGLTIGTANTYAGPTSLNGGAVVLAGSGTLGSGSSLTLGGSSLNLGGTGQTVGAVSVTTAAASGDTIANGSLTGSSYAVSNAANTVVISANLLLNGSAGLTKTGAGGLTLSGANTFTGATNLNGGAVTLTGAGALASVSSLTLGGSTLDLGGVSRTVTGGLIVASGTTGATLTNGSLTASSYDVTHTADDVIISANLLANGSAGFTKNGAGNLTLSGANTYTGVTTVNAGTLKVGGAAVFTGLGALTLGNAAVTIDLGGYNANFTNLTTNSANNTITTTGAGSGTDTLTISALTAASGALFTDDGIRKLALVFTPGAGTPAATTNIGNTFSGGLTLGPNTRINPFPAASTSGSPGAITSGPFGRGPITLNGTGTNAGSQIHFNAANLTLVNDVIVNSNTGNGSRAGSFRIQSTGAVVSGTVTANNLDAVFAADAAVSLSITGRLTGAQGFRFNQSSGTAAWTATLNNASTNNNYQGTTTVGSAQTTLQLGASNQIPNGAGMGGLALTLGTFDLNGYNETINGLTGAGIIDNVAATGGATNTLTLGDGDATGNSFTGTIRNATGSLAVVKIGSGTQTLATATNTFTGGLTIMNGIIQANVATVLGGTGGNTGTVTLGDASGSNAAGLRAGAAITISNPIFLQTNASAGVLSIGTAGNFAVTYSGGVTGTNHLTLANDGTALLTIGTAALNHAGRVTNAGAGSGNTSIGVGFGANVTDIIQNSATSTLSIASGVASSNTGDTYVKAGTLQLAGAGNSTTITPVSTGTIYLGDTAGSSAATLALGNTNTLANPINVQSNGNASVKAININTSGTPTYSGGITLNDNLDITAPSSSGLVIQTGLVTLNNGTVLSFKPSGTNAATFNVSSRVTGGGGLVFGGTTSGSPIYVLTGANDYTGTTTISKGTLRIGNAGTNGSLSPSSAITNNAALEFRRANGMVQGTDFANNIGGTGTVSFASGGTYTLTANSYQGGTVLSGAAATQLNLNHADALGTGALTINSGDNAKLDNTSGAPVTLSNNAQTWSNNFTFVGSNDLNMGTGAVTMSGSRTLTVSARTLTIGGNIGGAHALTKNGAGTLTLAGANTYSGVTMIGAGTLNAGSADVAGVSGALGNGGNIDFEGGVLQFSPASAGSDYSARIKNSGSAIRIDTNGQSVAFASALDSSNTGGLTKSGNGTLTLSGANTYTGATSVTGGALTAATGALAGTSGISVAGATFTAVDYPSSATLTLDALSTAVVSGANLNLAGAVTNEGSAASALNFSATSGTITLASLAGSGKTRFGRDAVITGGISSGVVTVVGALSAGISGGTVTTGTLSGAISGGTVTVSGVATITALTAGTVNLNGATSSIATLTAGTVNLGTTALTVQSGTFTGLLAGAQGSLIKTSNGTLTLSGANTFGGGTTVSAGTLVIGQAGSLGSGAVTVASGASLDLANFSVSNVITAATGASIINGPSTDSVSTTGTQSVNTVLTGTGGLTKSDGGELVLTTPNFFTGGVSATTAGAVISAAHLADGSSSLGASALNDPTKLVLGNGATLEFTGTTATTTSRSFTVSGSAALAVDASAAALTFSSASIMALDSANPTPQLKLVANNSGINRFEAQISADDLAAGRGLSSLVIDGTGQWVLGGAANRFKGDVRMEIGGGATLGFEAGSLGTGSTYASSVIEVGNGSKLAWSGSNSDDISGRLSVPAGATAKLDLGSNNVTFASAPTVATGASLEKQGTGVLKIAATVSAPTLNVAVTGGRLAVNGTLGNITLAQGATLGGSGTIGVATVASGATVAPGNSPGLLNGTSMTLAGGAIFEWEVQNATSTSGYDRINLTGNLDLRGANPGSRVTFKVISRLGSGDGNTVGDPLNFAPPGGAASIRTFQFGQVGGVLLNSGQNISDVFSFDLSQFTYSDGSASNAGLWSINWDSGTGAITVTAVPEPSTYGLGLGALALAAAALRRRRR